MRSYFHGFQPGFTVVEVMIALVLVSLALLALDRTTTQIVQRVADAHRESLAADVAHEQLNHIIATQCTTQNGADSVNGVMVQWTTRANAGFASTTQQIRYPIASGVHDESLEVMLPCR